LKKLGLDAFYLGNPVFSSKSKVKDFKYLIDNLDSKLKGWRSRVLSWASRRTLIQSVAQALPTYSFSTADVPKSVCNKLDSSIRRFWWNPKKDKGCFMAWNSWDSLCQPKELGGLGFRLAKDFNQALLAKITWWIVSGRDSLCTRALRSKYKVKSDWLYNDTVKNASPLWKAIEKLKPLIRKGACFSVGDGKSIDMWKDPWVPWLENFSPSPKDPNIPTVPMLVSNLIDPVNRIWNADLLRELVDTQSLQAIHKIVLPVATCQDKLIWTLDPKGNYTVKSAIKMNLSPRNNNTQVDTLWPSLWKLKMHERLKVFLWRLGSNAFPTNLRINQRAGVGDPICPLCGKEDESYPHIFLKCQVIKPIWFGLSWGLYPERIPTVNNYELLNFVINPPLSQGQSGNTKILSAKTSIQLALVF
jgi:hypothetical protein